MDIEWFIPLLLLFFVFVTALWFYESLGIVYGWKGVLAFLCLVFGVRVDWLRRQQNRRLALQTETVNWLENEILSVYNGTTDPSGRKFNAYSNLFGRIANCEQEILDAFDRKLEKLSAKRPVDGLRMPDLMNRLDIDMAYNSNAIEGNPITLAETTVILKGFVGGKRRSLRHVNDIVGHHKAFEAVQSMVAAGTKISLHQILNLHRLVLFDSDDGGVLRSGQELAFVSGKKVLFALPDETKNLVEKLVAWISAKEGTMHPFLLAVTVHYIFVRIHPFRDGNGRTARLIANLILMRGGCPLIIVPFKKRDSYMASLDEWDNDNTENFTSLMAECLDQSFKRYFTALNVS